LSEGNGGLYHARVSIGFKRNGNGRTFFAPAPAIQWPARVVGLVLLSLCAGAGGCATIRVTDPPRTATEQFLLSGAAESAIDQVSADSLRDRLVYIDTTYLTNTWQTAPELSFLMGEFRTKLLEGGARLSPDREGAQIVIEVRSGGVGVDRLEFLLGLPSIGLASLAGGGAAANAAPLLTPELAILKSTRQYSFASIAFVAYWADTGELLVSSGPFVGRRYREDWWIFGTGPRTVGDIAPAERRRK
jgi:hypothetical protein